MLTRCGSVVAAVEHPNRQRLDRRPIMPLKLSLADACCAPDRAGCAGNAPRRHARSSQPGRTAAKPWPHLVHTPTLMARRELS